MRIDRDHVPHQREVFAHVAALHRVEYRHQLSALSAATGESKGNLLVLQRAFDNTGIGAEKVKNVLDSMNRGFAGMSENGENVVPIFNQLGLNIKELVGKIPWLGEKLGLDGFTSENYGDIYDRHKGAIDDYNDEAKNANVKWFDDSKETGKLADWFGEAMKKYEDKVNAVETQANTFTPVGNNALPTDGKKKEEKAAPAVTADQLQRVGGMTGGFVSGLNKLADTAQKQLAMQQKQLDMLSKIAGRSGAAVPVWG